MQSDEIFNCTRSIKLTGEESAKAELSNVSQIHRANIAVQIVKDISAIRITSHLSFSRISNKNNEDLSLRLGL